MDEDSIIFLFMMGMALLSAGPQGCDANCANNFGGIEDMKE